MTLDLQIHAAADNLNNEETKTRCLNVYDTKVESVLKEIKF